MLRSPFVRRPLEKEKSMLKRLKEFVMSKLYDLFVQQIPSNDIRQMPSEYMFPFGIFSILLLFGIFFAIFIQGYYTQADTKYLSPLGTSAVCTTVPISNTGNFLATQEGDWSGNAAFTYPKAAYSISVVSLQISQIQYATLMWDIYAKLQEIGSYAYNNTLATNLLIWMTYVWLDPSAPTQRFYFVGDATVVFATEKVSGGISSISSDCNNNSIANYDQANGILQLSYVYESFIASPRCQNILNTRYAGYSKYSNPSIFETTLDVRSLVVAVSVNLEIITLNKLQKLSTSTLNLSYNGSVVNASAFIDPAAPNMQPVFCLEHPLPSRCVIIIGEIFGLPIFNHVGASIDYPTPCNCSHLHQLNSTISNNYFQICNSFSLLSGLLFFNTTKADGVLSLTDKFSYQEIVDNSYYPMFIGSTFGLNSPYYDEFQNSSYRENAYEFCYSEELNMSCSFLIFSSFSLDYPSWSISEYYYQVPNGACVDAFMTSEENWSKLINTPFAPLSQQYETCQYSTQTVLLNQTGIAFGNLSILAPFAVIFISVIIYLYQFCSGKVISKGYTQNEKDQALNAFAISLLLAKDGKLEEIHKKLTNKTFGKRNEGDLEENYSSNDNSNDEGMKYLDILVQELYLLGKITEKDYFEMRKLDLESETTSINWTLLQRVLFSGKSNRRSTSKHNEFSPSFRPDSSQQNLFELSEVNNPIMRQSNLSNYSSSLSRGSQNSRKSIKIQVLNKSEVNIKDRRRYEEEIRGKSLNFIVLELPTSKETAVMKKPSFDGAPLIKDVLNESIAMVSPSSLDIVSIRQLVQQILPTDFKFSSLSSGNTSTNQESSLLLELSAIMDNRSFGYNPEILKVIVNYWIPKIDYLSEKLSVMVANSKDSSLKNNLQSTPQEYWTLSAATSELQLFTLFPKELLQQFVNNLKNLHSKQEIVSMEEDSALPNNKKGNEPQIDINSAEKPSLDLVSELTNTAETVNPSYRCSEEDFQLVFFLLITYKKFFALLLFHTMLSVSEFDEGIVLKKFGSQMAYFIGDELWTIADLKHWVEIFRDILL